LLNILDIEITLILSLNLLGYKDKGMLELLLFKSQIDMDVYNYIEDPGITNLLKNLISIWDYCNIELTFNRVNLDQLPFNPLIPFDGCNFSEISEEEIINNYPIPFVHAIIFDNSGNTVLCKEKLGVAPDGSNMPPYFNIPGGSRNPNELPVRTVQREVFEELGINIDRDKFKYLGSLITALKGHEIAIPLYTAKFEDSSIGRVEPTDSNSNDDIKEILVTDIKSLQNYFLKHCRWQNRDRYLSKTSQLL
jgi:8-oxo-dGTP pyrophosphatase MutT (NUDIX family)